MQPYREFCSGLVLIQVEVERLGRILLGIGVSPAQTAFMIENVNERVACSAPTPRQDKFTEQVAKLEA